MSFQVGNACYPQAVNAAQAIASQVVGTVVQHGGQAYGVAVDSVSGAQISYRLSPVTGGSPVALVVPFSPQECQLLTAEDGAQIGWMVAAAWAGAYGILFMVRAFRGETSTDGNT